MPQFFANYEALPVTQAAVRPSVYHDPILGIDIPLERKANLEWRRKLLASIEEDPNQAAVIWNACKASVIFFICFACFSIRKHEVREGEIIQSPDTIVPFLPWSKQLEILAEMEIGIKTKGDYVGAKGRDLGFTWMVIYCLTWRFIFHPNSDGLLISRKEGAVEVTVGSFKNYPHGTRANPGTLFGKIDFILAKLPSFLMPRLARKALHVVNLDNGSTLSGEATTSTAGASDRTNVVFIDEAGLIEPKAAADLKRSTGDVAATRFIVSTRTSAGHPFEEWIKTGKVLWLFWYDDPDKSHGLYVHEDSKTGRQELCSPWYDNKKATLTSTEFASQVCGEVLESGHEFFDAAMIRAYIKRFASRPKHSVSILFKKGMDESDVRDSVLRRRILDVSAQLTARGDWLLWCPLLNERPAQDCTYTFGVDISEGMGASNSTVSVIRDDIREKVAGFANATVQPHDFAKLICAAAIWFGGTRHPKVVFESNGSAGWQFNKTFTSLYQYPNTWRDRPIGTSRTTPSKRYGWHSSIEKKAALIGELSRAYMRREFLNRCEASIEECLLYISFTSGYIGPSHLVMESNNARRLHGDRVIADALAWKGAEEEPRAKARTYDEALATAPLNTMAGRYYEAMQEQKTDEDWLKVSV